MQAAFGHVKTDLVTTARRKRVKDIRVNGALLPVVVLAVKRSVDDILSRTYSYLQLEEGRALLQQGLATLSEIIDAGEFNAPVFVGHHRYHTFEGTVIHVREDGEYDVTYDEGGTETRVPARFLRRRTRGFGGQGAIRRGRGRGGALGPPPRARDFVPSRGVGW